MKLSQSRASTLTALLLALCAMSASAAGIGRIKTLAGDVTVERNGKRMPAVLGAAVESSDKIFTGKDGSVGLLFDDDSRLALGRNSSLSLDRFDFDFETNDGGMDVSVNRGTLSVISGKLTRKTPGALKVRTPAAILAVRGTEFSVSVADDGTLKSTR